MLVYDDEMAVKHDESDFSASEDEENQDIKKKTNKSIYRDKIAKNLVNSHDKVDKRMLKIHRIVEKSHQKVDLISYLGSKKFCSVEFL